MPGLSDARSALSFLTVLPAGRIDHEQAQPGAAAAWFPVVGALVGGLAGGLRALTLGALGGTAASILGVTLMVAVTGALHHDGLADSADALGVRGDRERRLAVMRDPRIGVFGTLALIAWSLLMVAALAPLTRLDGLRSLVAAAVTGRCLALVHARAIRPARTDGLGATFHPTTAGLLVGSSITLAGVLSLCGPLPGGVALASAAITCATVSLWSTRVIGGRTGDTLGATVVLAEAAVCLTLLGFWR